MPRVTQENTYPGDSQTRTDGQKDGGQDTTGGGQTPQPDVQRQDKRTDTQTSNPDVPKQGTQPKEGGQK